MTTAMPRQLLSIAHSYVVSLNRRLVNEMARLGEDDWEVTAVAPKALRGDLRSVKLEWDDRDTCNLEATPVYFSQPIHLMLYGAELQTILRRDWDIVHCWQEPYILSGGQIAWWTPGGALLVYSTFQNYVKNYPPPFQWIERYAMHRAAGWTGFGQTVIQAMQQRPGYDRPHCLIPPGVDTDYFCPDAAAGERVRQSLEWSSDGPPVIGYLGRFVPEKGLHLLMEVLDHLPIPWRALLVGSGPMEEEMRQWARKYPQQVRVCSNVTHEQVPQYLNAMTLLCAPSQTRPYWREQFGRMLIEAFACGLPVIGSDSGEIPFVLQDAGLVVGEQDRAGWQWAITQVLESVDLQRELAIAGRERARSVYAWPIVARQYLDFFSQLLEER